MKPSLLAAPVILTPMVELVAQGPLTPPGAPAPTMKTLAQIEPRTPIPSTPFSITTSGSYYLTTNLAVAAGNAITITSDNVTLDLNGFTISSTANPAAGAGVLVSGARNNISIRNGHLKGQVVFSVGSCIDSTSGRNLLVSEISVSGCMDDGIYLGTDDSTLVSGCAVHTVGGAGILAATVHNSTARECGFFGISAETASNCAGHSTSASTSLTATTASNCRGSSENGTAISANIAIGCTANSGMITSPGGKFLGTP